MYNPKDTQFVGKYDYDIESALKMSWMPSFNKFSVGIFQWEMKSNGKTMKRGKIKVRVVGECANRNKVFQIAEDIVRQMDNNTWDNSIKRVKVAS